MKDDQEDVETESQRVEVTLSFNKESIIKLDEIKNKAKLETRAETVRNALRFYDWYLNKKIDGFQLCVEKDDVLEEVELKF